MNNKEEKNQMGNPKIQSQKISNNENLDFFRLNKQNNIPNNKSTTNINSSNFNNQNMNSKVAPGKVVDNNGNIQKSAGREIVDGAENVIKIISGNKSKNGYDKYRKQKSLSNKKNSNIKKIGQKKELTPLNSSKEKVKDKLGDKIDNAAEKSKRTKRQVEETALAAKSLNQGVDAVNKAKSGRMVSAAKSFIESKKNFKEYLKRKIIGIAIVGFVIFFIVEFIIAVVMNFINIALEGLDNAANGVANIHEKTDNFFSGFGFRNSEDAFYHELNHLNEEHGGELNVPLIIATIFYDDIHGSGDEGFDLTDDDGENGAMALALARRWIKEKVRESNETIGEDGLRYSSNKIYRLRKLARHQFDKGSNKIEHNVSLSEYLEVVKNNIDTELLDWIKAYVVSLKQITDPAGVAESLYQWLVAGDETFFTTDTGGALENLKDEFEELLEAIFSPFFDIEKVSIGGSCGGVVCVKYNTYGYNEEVYDNYLKNHYIKNMPEFKKYISSNDDTIKEKEIDNIIREIHLMAEEYEEIYGVKKKSTENYNNTTCTGNIKESLLGDLEKPVSIPSGTTVSFTGKYAYGISGGTSHKGVDLNNTTAGVSEGADVYSVYSSGKVIESTFDKTYSDKNVNGGWLKIKYINTSGNEAYDFTITYGGLDPSSITLKKDSVVNKGDVIGKIGSKDDSEDKDISSLHFGFYDNTSKTYQDPTNLFIPCEGFDGSDAKLFLMHNVNSISESNFISAVESYCANNACNSEINAWSLSSVYRDSVSANLNPTFVVSRAFVEGFSPGGSSYNYWGVGCTNKCPSCCHRYNSIKEGIEDLASLRIISEYETLFDSLRSYAYIGDYWYPGSWSDGGCIYLPYMESHYVNKSRYIEVKNWCDSGTGSSHPTTDEDQDAYANFQCEKTLDIYKAIFKPE